MVIACVVKKLNSFSLSIYMRMIYVVSIMLHDRVLLSVDTPFFFCLFLFYLFHIRCDFAFDWHTFVHKFVTQIQI